jgi:hypothetical protein
MSLPAYLAVNAQSAQVTLKRLDLAFNAFFRRIGAGGEPGFPRFKTKDQFPGFGFKTHGDGGRRRRALHAEPFARRPSQSASTVASAGSTQPAIKRRRWQCSSQASGYQVGNRPGLAQASLKPSMRAA